MNSHDSTELLIINYNEEFVALVERAVAGQYHRLFENFLSLADLYTVLQRLAALEGQQIDIPSPLVVLDHEALRRLGYNNQRLSKLEQFFSWIQRKYNQDFRSLLTNRMNWPKQRAA